MEGAIVQMLSGTSLHLRFTLLIGLTVAAIVGVSVYLGVSAVDDTEKTAQRETLTLTAQTVADHVDDVLVRTMGRDENDAKWSGSLWRLAPRFVRHLRCA